MKLNKITDWEYDSYNKDNVTTYEDGEVVNERRPTLGKYDSVRQILATSQEIGDHLPNWSAVTASIGIHSNGSKPQINHREIFIRGYERLIKSGYTCDIEELVEEYRKWYGEYRFRPSSKSHLNKSWGNGLGDDIIEDIEWQWQWY